MVLDSQQPFVIYSPFCPRTKDQGFQCTPPADLEFFCVRREGLQATIHLTVGIHLDVDFFFFFFCLWHCLITNYSCQSNQPYLWKTVKCYSLVLIKVVYPKDTQLLVKQLSLLEMWVSFRIRGTQKQQSPLLYKDAKL